MAYWLSGCCGETMVSFGEKICANLTPVQVIQVYLESQVMEKLADAQRAQQEATAPQLQAGEKRRGAQPEEQGSRGSSNLPTAQLVEGLRRKSEAKAGRKTRLI